jgi:CDP-glycerol glycerophosphotransferase (TagB/SpsB family)
MSVGDWIREILAALFKLCRGAMGWVFVSPIAKVMPRRRDWVAVIGRDEGKFVGNAKYFFLQAASTLNHEVRVAFITERQDVADLLAGTDCEVLIYPSWQSIRFLLRAGVMVVDSSEWVWKLSRFLVVGARKVQLWHGVGYKRVELDKWKNEVSEKSFLSSSWMLFTRKVTKAVNGRLVRFDLVNTTSMFYRKSVFEPAFLSGHYSAAGYPRNTFGELGAPIRGLAWKNVDKSIASRLTTWTSAKKRIVLVAPTFRDSRGSPLGLDSETVTYLNTFCERNGVELIFNFHPLERRASEVSGEHLHICDPGSDFYPLLPISDALITDYSSIYMDYLLLDKPVLFLVPDLEDYVSKDRQFQFDFHKMTPGPKLATWRETTAGLLEQWERDTFAEERARLRKLAFDDLPQDQATPKLINFMRTQGWFVTKPTKGSRNA